MANATHDMMSPLVQGGGKVTVLKVGPAAHVYERTMVAQMDASPRDLVAGTTPGSGNCIGVAMTHGKPGGDCEVWTDAQYLFESVIGPGAVSVDTVDIGGLLYMDDDHTVTSEADDGVDPLPIAGLFMGIESDGLIRVWVKPNLRKPPEVTVTIPPIGP
ncbi:MAG: hypothetical protein FWD57_15300 [Polyangiaceae bacterium]|nr:hypothetical protein [Polyangiaceae bacterium]